MYQLVKKLFKVAVLPHLTLQQVKEAFPNGYSLSILPYKFLRTNVKLIYITNSFLINITLINNIDKLQIMPVNIGNANRLYIDANGK